MLRSVDSTPPDFDAKRDHLLADAGLERGERVRRLEQNAVVEPCRCCELNRSVRRLPNLVATKIARSGAQLYDDDAERPPDQGPAAIETSGASKMKCTPALSNLSSAAALSWWAKPRSIKREPRPRRLGAVTAGPLLSRHSSRRRR